MKILARIISSVMSVFIFSIIVISYQTLSMESLCTTCTQTENDSLEQSQQITELQKTAFEAMCKNFGVISSAEIKTILLNRMKPYVRKTVRPTSFYHYGKRDRWIKIPNTGTAQPKTKINSTQYAEEEYFKSGSARFFTQNGSEFGPAIYAAADPLQSVGYSDENNGMLLKIGLPSNIPYLDVRVDHRNIYSTQLEAEKALCFYYQNSDKQFISIQIQQLERMKSENNFNVDFADIRKTEAGKLVLKDVFKTLGIRLLMGGYGHYSFQECHLDAKQTYMGDAVFFDPTLSKQLKLEIIVPELENNTSPQKRLLYSDFLKFFDAYQCETTEKKEECILTKKQDSSQIDRFWQYYSAIAPVIHNVPKDTNFQELQKKKAQEWAPKRAKELSPTVFGCSKDPKHTAEAIGATQKQGK